VIAVGSPIGARTATAHAVAHDGMGDHVHELVVSLRAAGAKLAVDPADGHLIVAFGYHSAPDQDLLQAVVDDRHAVADYLRAEDAAREAERAMLLDDLDLPFDG
jgi:hypothetical protein